MQAAVVLVVGAIVVMVITQSGAINDPSREELMEVEIEMYFEDDRVADSSGRVKRNVAKQRKRLDIKISDMQGKASHIAMEKVKDLKPKTDKFTFRNGVIVPEVAVAKTYEVFVDYANNTGSVMLMSCDDQTGSCLSMGSFINGTEALLLQSFNSTPYATKGKKFKASLNAIGDKREMGIAADGTPLGVPTTTRKKRDINLTPRMRRNLFRKRRQAVTSHVVELLIMADYSEYMRWVDRSSSPEEARDALEMYYIMMTNMMDERFETILIEKGDVDISIMINAIVYIEEESMNPFTQLNEISPGVYNVDTMLDDLTVWAWSERASFPPHDHVMMVTNLDLASLKGGTLTTSTLGAAWTGGMCDAGYSVSIIEDSGLGLIDYVATHEIGHSLSSNHDLSSGCDDADFYVMGSTGGSPAGGLYGTGSEGNPWTFSTCTTDTIYSFVTGLGSGSCLLDSTYDQASYDAYKTYLAPGVIIPIDAQCELQYGTGSRRCYAIDASICSDGAYCWNPADPSFCYTLYVRQGTLCGDMMRCHHGLCENSTLVMPTCPPVTNVPVDGVIDGSVTTTVSPPTSAAAIRAKNSDTSVQLNC